MLDAWPLVGRGAEHDEIWSLLGAGRGVVIAGPAGIGKSRLMDEIAGALDPDEWHVERVVGTPAIATFPLGAFAFLEEPATIEMGRYPTPLGSTRRALLDRAGGRRVLLAIDDAHVLDGASAALAYQLAATRGVVVVATLRSPMTPPEEVVALWKNGHCERIDLQALARHEVNELVAMVLGGVVHEKTKGALWDASQGNLLFLRELIRDGLRRGSLTNDGTWRWQRPSRPPASVQELIARQLDGVSPHERHALELVALAEPLEWELLAELVPTVVVDEHLVATDDGVRRIARLSHPLIGDVLRSDLSEARRRELFGELVDAAAPRARRRSDALRYVTWMVDGGRQVAPEDLLEAARRAMLHDSQRAESLARLAEEQGATRAAGVVRAQILMFGNRPAEAESLLSALETTEPDDDVSVNVMRANNLTFGLYDPVGAVAVLDELLSRTTDEVHAALLRSQRLPMLLFAGDARGVVAGANELLANAKVEPADQLRAYIALVPALAVVGQPLEALRLAEAARPLVAEAEPDLPYAIGQLAAGAILALQWAGQLAQAEAIARLGYEHGMSLDAALLRGVSAYQLGLCAYWRGAERTARRHFEDAVDVMRATDVGFLPSACDHLAAVGGPPADEVLRDGMRFPLYETERLRLAGVAAAARREYERARELAAEAAVAAHDGGLAVQELFAYWDQARWGGIDTVAVDIQRTALQCEGELAPVLATAAAAWSNRDGVGIENAATELERLGFVLWAAELGRVAAHAFAGAGFAARAAGVDARAASLLARCEGASTFLSEWHLGSDAPELTRREREIVELAVLGTTNADIAVLLSISVRTVEAHLQHVYTKLGVSSRHELAEQFGSAAGPPT